MSIDRPNILLITTDQQHFSTLGAINDRIKTAALDHLCREGVRFDRAYWVNPRCRISVYRKWPDGEPFHVAEDPGEVNNLWHDPGVGGLKSQLLHEFLQARMQCGSTPMPRIAGA